jgi:hypothetical protein
MEEENDIPQQDNIREQNRWKGDADVPPKKPSSHRISTFEWVIVITLLGLIDLIQIVLVLFAGIGLIIDRIISLITGIIWGTYKWYRVGSVSGTKKIISFLGVFVLEETPIIDVFPSWSLDAIYTMILSRSEEKIDAVIEKVPGGRALTTM